MLVLAGVVAVLFAANSACSADYSDCKTHAIGMGGDALGSGGRNNPLMAKSDGCSAR